MRTASLAFLALVAVALAIVIGPSGCGRPIAPRPPYHEPVAQKAAIDHVRQ